MKSIMNNGVILSRAARAVTLCLAGGLAAPALGHNHITVDTAGGHFGDTILVKAGYEPGESGYSFLGGVLTLNSVPVTYQANQVIDGISGYNGWLFCDELVLTSDAFEGTGRLVGGNFAYEIQSLKRTTGGGPSVMAWGEPNGSSFTFSARSDGASRTARSLVVGVGSHVHGQGFALRDAGEYDVTLVAWDLNGVYTDSRPVTFHVRAAPPCIGDINNDGVVNTVDLGSLLGEFGHTVDEDDANDINHDGVVNTVDLGLLLGRFGHGC